MTGQIYPLSPDGIFYNIPMVNMALYLSPLPVHLHPQSQSPDLHPNTNCAAFLVMPPLQTFKVC